MGLKENSHTHMVEHFLFSYHENAVVINVRKTATNFFISYWRWDHSAFVLQMLSLYVTYICPWEGNKERVAGSESNIKNTSLQKIV
jgi:hypothetical protein